jgi:hypothetical protein
MDEQISQKFYYPEVTKNEILMKVFDFDNFLDHTRLGTLLAQSSGSGLDFAKISFLLTRLIKEYEVNTNRNSSKLLRKFDTPLFDVCFDLSFIPVFKNRFNSFNVTDINQYNFYKTNIYNIVYHKYLDFSDLNSIAGQIINLPDKQFEFGKQLVGFNQEFDVKAFKHDLADDIFSTMYSVFFFKMIRKNFTSCEDFKCKRLFLLAKYVFGYFLFMSIFLIIFGDPEVLKAFKTTNNLTMEKTDYLKHTIIVIMDDILSLLQEENMLDSTGKGDKTSLALYYEQAKKLSDKNVIFSRVLNKKKNTALIMQNNLNNFTNNEVLTLRARNRAKIVFWTLAIISVFTISSCCTFIWLKIYRPVHMISSAGLFGIAIYALVSAILSARQN